MDITIDRRDEGTRIGRRIAGWAGVLWAVMSFGRLPLTGEVGLPTWDAGPDQIVEFYRGIPFGAKFVVGIAMVTIGWAFLPVFMAWVSDRLEPPLRWMGRLMFGGAIFELGLTTVYLGIVTTSVYWASHVDVGPDAYAALHGLLSGLLWVDCIVASLLWLTPLGIVALRTGLLPTWLGWAILATVAASIAGFFIGSFAWVNATGGIPYIWVAIAGISLLRSESGVA